MVEPLFLSRASQYCNSIIWRWNSIIWLQLHYIANLWRAMVHGYLWPETNRTSSECGHIVSSAEKETTFDNCKDLVLSAWCQFWEAGIWDLFIQRYPGVLLPSGCFQPGAKIYLNKCFLVIFYCQFRVVQLSPTLLFTVVTSNCQSIGRHESTLGLPQELKHFWAEELSSTFKLRSFLACHKMSFAAWFPGCYVTRAWVSSCGSPWSQCCSRCTAQGLCCRL